MGIRATLLHVTQAPDPSGAFPAQNLLSSNPFGRQTRVAYTGRHNRSVIICQKIATRRPVVKRSRRPSRLPAIYRAFRGGKRGPAQTPGSSSGVLGVRPPGTVAFQPYPARWWRAL